MAEAPAPLAAQDAPGAGDVVDGEVDCELDCELAELGVDGVPADEADVCAGVVDPAAVDPDDVAAQPAAEPATASTVSAEMAARRTERLNVFWFARALKGISFVTFQKTLYPLARLHRIPSAILGDSGVLLGGELRSILAERVGITTFGSATALILGAEK